MKRKVIFMVCVMVLASSVLGQYVRINGSGAGNALYFNLDRLWAYNAYEASRWGAGLRYDVGLGSGGVLRTLSLEGYGGYGYSDQRFKWGVEADLQSRLRGKPHVYAGYFHDLTHDAGRRLDQYRLSAFTANFDFMARRFSETDRFYGGVGWEVTRRLKGNVEVYYSRERRLFGMHSVYYPAGGAERAELPLYRLTEGRVTLRHSAGVQAEVLLGSGEADQFMGREAFPLYGRLLVQYDTTYRTGGLYVHPYVQGGVTTRGLPYSRHFDLGGTGGSVLLLSRSLTSASANEFTANVFALGVVKAGFQKALFDLRVDWLQLGLHPRPFVQVGAMWGRLWDEDEDGLVWHDEMEMQSPSRGLAEVGAGIDGLLRWGAIDWGAAFFYRLVPPEAPYRQVHAGEDWTFLFTAVLTL